MAAKSTVGAAYAWPGELLLLVVPEELAPVLGWVAIALAECQQHSIRQS
jgi:hypothetical protein